jgi:putative ABC transport system ATP-binding protein
MQPVIVAEKLGKTYRTGKVEVHALRSVSFSVAAGEFVSIVGPSGSGKSTLFYTLGGLTRPSTGRLLIDGVDFASLSDAERTRLRKHKIGFVFQKFNLLPTLNAMDNILLAHEIASGTKKLDKTYFDHLTELLGIRGRLQHRPSELSGGEQQRVAIADEPTGNLDSKNSDAVLAVLRRSNQELKQTVMMITHNPEAAAVGDRILHMRDGELLDAETHAALEASSANAV